MKTLFVTLTALAFLSGPVLANCGKPPSQCPNGYDAPSNPNHGKGRTGTGRPQ